jgi:hypothetical protein
MGGAETENRDKDETKMRQRLIQLLAIGMMTVSKVKAMMIVLNSQLELERVNITKLRCRKICMRKKTKNTETLPPEVVLGHYVSVYGQASQIS